MREQLRLSDANAAAYLVGRGHLRAGEAVALEPAGDGNINWVRRARIVPAGRPDGKAPAGRSLILKQARSALERFPEYAVTTERIVFEARYFAAVRPLDATGICPEVLDFDERERVLVLEDLGSAERLDHALACGPAAPGLARSARALAAFLGTVHAATAGDPTLAAHFENGDMRRLHGDHVFALPFHPNDFPLSPALRARAQSVWADAELVAIADAAYARYLAPNGALVHGDVQAGNVLLPAVGPKLLDAEIAHVGDPAFDLGMLLAHLSVEAIGRGHPKAAAPLVAAAWSGYAGAAGASASGRFAEAARYAGIELLRRTLGAARVAAVASDDGALRVLDAALRWIRRPPSQPDELLSPPPG